MMVIIEEENPAILEQEDQQNREERLQILVKEVSKDLFAKFSEKLGYMIDELHFYDDYIEGHDITDEINQFICDELKNIITCEERKRK